MQYLGGKKNIAKQILSIVLQNRNEGQYYVEPFCGGCATLSEVSGPRIGADAHRYLISMLQAVSRGWLPKQEYSEFEYLKLKNNPDICPVTSGYVGFQLSFGAKWFGSYVKPESQIKNNRDPKCLVGYRQALKQFPKLIGVDFKCCSYQDLDIPPNSIIYCDPPYENTEGYDGLEVSFNHIEFWEWCRSMVKEGHSVFISEYNAPVDFTCIWEKTSKHNFRAHGGSRTRKTKTEKLFHLGAYNVSNNTGY